MPLEDRIVVGGDKATPRTALSAADAHHGLSRVLHVQYLDSDGQLWYVTRKVGMDVWGDPHPVEGATVIPGSRLAASGAGDGRVFVAYQTRHEVKHKFYDFGV